MSKAGKSKFDIAVINLVRRKRQDLGLTQDDLAFYLDVHRSYVGQVERPESKSKYNLNQLNRLAFEMKCSPQDFIPSKATDEKIVSGRRKQKK